MGAKVLIRSCQFSHHHLAQIAIEHGKVLIEDCSIHHGDQVGIWAMPNAEGHVQSSWIYNHPITNIKLESTLFYILDLDVSEPLDVSLLEDDPDKETIH